MTPDPTYVPDADKLEKHARLNQSPQRLFIQTRGGVAHIGLRQDLLGDRSGLILSVSYVAACSGKQIGGPWGYTRSQVQPVDSDICPRCAKYAVKHGIDQ